MLLAKQLLGALSFLMASASLAASPRPSDLKSFEELHTFHSRRQDIPFVLRPDLVAVAQGTSLALPPAALPLKELTLFSQLNVTIITKITFDSAKLRPDQMVGIPIWFNKDSGAVGILTKEIVLRTSTPLGLAALNKAPALQKKSEALFKPGVYLATFTSPLTALAAANVLATKQGILYAHPNFMVPKDWRQEPSQKPTSATNNPFFTSQWHLKNTGQMGGTIGADLHVTDAWLRTKGSNQVIIAVLDGGLQTSHPDFVNAFAINQAEIADNHIDDDHNGYVDDTLGWNFISSNSDVSTSLFADHGTSVAGLLGAKDNGIGVVGVCPDCLILPVTLAWTMADDAAAFYYAKSRGAQIITNSWGYIVGTPETDVVVDAIDDVAATGRDGKGMIILFAMNNLNQDDCTGPTPDISSLDSVTAVSSSSDQDKRVVMSAWGECMEFLAPSYAPTRQGMVTTDLMGIAGNNNGHIANQPPDADYTNSFSGTSASTPLVAGIFGLMLAVKSELTCSDAVAILAATADKIEPDLAHYNAETGFSSKYGFGRVNAARAVEAAARFHKFSRREGFGKASYL